MKITHVISTLAPEGGGPPVVAERLAATQADMGHDVSIVTHAFPAAAAESLRAVPGGGEVVVRETGASSLDRLLVRRSATVLRASIVGSDFVHLHSMWHPILAVAARTARRAGVPYTVMPHGALDPWSLAQKSPKKSAAWTAVFRSMVNGAAYLHLLNDTERDLLGPLDLSVPTAVVPNGVHLPEVDSYTSAGDTSDWLPDVRERPYILFLSRLHHKKGLDHLAAAFDVVSRRVDGPFRDLQLVVAGPDEGARAAFEQEVDARGLRPRVHLPGPLYGAAKFRALRGARAFCLPSRQEGFPVVALEAMACEVPVVLSTECRVPGVEESGAGIVVRLQPDSIADALERVVEDSDMQRRMGRAGRDLVERQFTWTRVGEQTMTLYSRYVAGS